MKWQATSLENSCQTLLPAQVPILKAVPTDRRTCDAPCPDIGAHQLSAQSSLRAGAMAQAPANGNALCESREPQKRAPESPDATAAFGGGGGICARSFAVGPESADATSRHILAFVSRRTRYHHTSGLGSDGSPQKFEILAEMVLIVRCFRTQILTPASSDCQTFRTRTTPLSSPAINHHNNEACRNCTRIVSFCHTTNTLFSACVVSVKRYVCQVLSIHLGSVISCESCLFNPPRLNATSRNRYVTSA